MDRINACMMASKCMEYIEALVSCSVQNSGEVVAMDHDSVCVLGLIGKSFTCTPVIELKACANFDARTHSITWWKQIHLLMCVLSNNFKTGYIGEDIDVLL